MNASGSAHPQLLMAAAALLGAALAGCATTAPEQVDGSPAPTGWNPTVTNGATHVDYWDPPARSYCA